MKTFRSLMTAGALAGMLASGTAMAGEAAPAAGASSAPAAKLAVSQVRQSASVEKKSKLTSEALVPVGLAAVGIVGAIVIAADGDDSNDLPDSAG